MTKLFHSIEKSGIGVMVHNVNLGKELPPYHIVQIQELLNNHRVVIFKGQNLTSQQVEDFAFRFGPPFIPDKKNPVLGSEDSTSSVVIVGNQAHEYTHSYLGHQEVLLHSDHQWLRNPSAASLLYAVDIEKGSAPTVWVDMVNAYNSLDSETRKKIEGLKIITYNPFYRPFGSVSAKYVDRSKDVPPGDIFSHPLVRTHPLTQAKSLYLHIAYEMEFVGVSYEVGSQLYSYLQDHINNLECRYEHHWEKGDLVFWDNRVTLHYRPAFESNVRRVLKRVTIGGEIPF